MVTLINWTDLVHEPEWNQRVMNQSSEWNQRVMSDSWCDMTLGVTWANRKWFCIKQHKVQCRATIIRGSNTCSYCMVLTQNMNTMTNHINDSVFLSHLVITWYKLHKLAADMRSQGNRMTTWRIQKPPSSVELHLGLFLFLTSFINIMKFNC